MSRPLTGRPCGAESYALSAPRFFIPIFCDGGTRQITRALMQREKKNHPGCGPEKIARKFSGEQEPFPENGKREIKVQIDNAVISAVADALKATGIFATKSELDKAVAEVMRRAGERGTRAGSGISLSRLIRGARIESGLPPINKATAQSDAEYCKTMSTGSTPGSYLVPTLQADEIIAMLETGGVARSAGVRIWPMQGVQKMNVPGALLSPAWVWMAQNSAQTPTDPNLGQMSFSLNERRCLIAIPNQLLAVSVPAMDTVLSGLIGLAAAAHEDAAFFATSQVTGGPLNLYSQSGVTIIHANGNSANGGNLVYTDILAVLAKAAANKATGPFVWFASPRTLYQRIMGMLDLSSRPIYIPTLTQGLEQTGIIVGGNRPVGMLMGYPVFVTPYIPETDSLGSGTNLAKLIFTNPKYCHIAEDQQIEIAISTERYFDAAQTAIRAVNHEDFGVSPAAGVTILDGIA
jgi:HK97 family phage major capsid protein